MSLYSASVPQLSKMLNNLDAWLESSITFAETKGFDPELLLAGRLAPDQHPLSRQIQMACDAAKFAAARPSQTEPPVHPDTETTLAELRTRIKATTHFLDSIDEAAFEGAEERMIQLSYLPEGTGISGVDYLNELALPNFYFHANTAYGILRHSGVPLGKRAYIGSMNIQPL